jgi:hypothetical protein
MPKNSAISLNLLIEKFDSKGEKTGWSYVRITASMAGKLNPGVKKSFRVKGFIDDLPVRRLALIPMGDGEFIIPINADIRKATGKKAGDRVLLNLELDKSAIPLDKDLLLCLEDDPVAKSYFHSLSPSHRVYFSGWISEAKTLATKTKRIRMTLEALSNRMNFGEMLRFYKSK